MYIYRVYCVLTSIRSIIGRALLLSPPAVTVSLETCQASTLIGPTNLPARKLKDLTWLQVSRTCLVTEAQSDFQEQSGRTEVHL